MRAGQDPERWETAADLAVSLIPVLADAPARTVLNLNVPSLTGEELRGVRRGRLSTAGLIKAATDRVRREPTADGTAAPPDQGEIHLTLGAAVPTLGDVTDEEPDDDGALVAAGFASLTAVVGVREDARADADEVVRRALGSLNELN
jgi:broad specificity polyphosphatase/5'/3'-nucleotidase SurE